MKLRPMNKMMILIRERIVETNSVFILWIIIMTAARLIGPSRKSRRCQEISTSITLWLPRLFPKVLCIVEAGQELLVLRVAWHPHDRSLRAQNTAPGWFQHVGVFAQQFGPYSVFPQLGHQNKAAKTAICKRRSPSSTWSDCPLSASVWQPTPPWPSSRRHLRIQQTDKNASAQIYYLSMSGFEMYGKASIIFCEKMLQATGGLSHTK